MKRFFAPLRAWLWPCVALALLMGLALLGNALVIGERLGRVSPYAMWAFYGSASALLLWCVVYPAAALLRTPSLALEDLRDYDPQTLRKITKRFLDARPADRHPELRIAYKRGGALRDLLAEAIQTQSDSASELIRRHASIVLVSTALSQNGRLDGLAVLIINIRMVRELARHFGYRPSLRELSSLLIQVILASLVADSLEDLDMAELIGPESLAAIPGAKTIADSLVEGAANAFLTLRVGFVARKCLLNAGKALTTTEVRKNATREARDALKPLMQDLGQKLFRRVWPFPWRREPAARP